MTFIALLVALFLSVGVYVGAATGGASAFLLAAGWIQLALLFHLDPIGLILTTWTIYCAGFLGASHLQQKGLDIGVGAALQYSVPQNQVPGFWLYRILILGIFILLPIGMPPGNVTGPIATILILGVAVVASPGRDPIESNLWALLCCGIITALLFLTRDHVASVIPLISALALPSCLTQKQNPSTTGDDSIPPPPWVLMGAILAFITPGATHAGIAAAFPPGIARLTLAMAVEAAVEGWNLQALLRGYGPQKSPLADLLINQKAGSLQLVGSFQYPGWMPLACCGILILVTLRTRYGKTLDIKPNRSLMAVGLVAQGFCAAGLWFIPFLVTGLALWCLKETFRPDDHNGYALAFMTPMLLPR